MSQKQRAKAPKPEPELFESEESAQPAVNREPRVTVTLALDITSSIFHPGGVYEEAVRRMFEECGKHPAARTSAFVSVCPCGPRFIASPYQPFVDAMLPEMEPRGGSPGGMWLKSAVRTVRAEHERMKSDAVPSNKDVFLFISDWRFDDGIEAFDRAVEAYRALEKERPQFNGFMVMAGRHPDRELAARVSNKRQPVHLDELKVDELFRWVSVVVQRASMSRPGESVELPTPTWTLNDGRR